MKNANVIRKVATLCFLGWMLPVAVTAADVSLVKGTNGEDGAGNEKCPMVKIPVKRLPDLNIPRSGHALFYANGEITVAGGHTKSFVPTATAEYYKDGKWHVLQTEYPHDDGLCVKLRSGKVLLAGGHEKPLGIGQTFPVEIYDPAAHVFHGFSSLSTQRSMANGVEVDSGKVVVAGNYYASDNMEMYDGDRLFHPVKGVSSGRARPLMLRISPNQVIIFGGSDTKGILPCSDIVDRLNGEPFQVPLLKRWKPLPLLAQYESNLSFIGNEATGDYSYLIAMHDYDDANKKPYQERQLAFVLVRDTVFSLLPTVSPVPMTGVDSVIYYVTPTLIDKASHRGYVAGFDNANRFYVLRIDYDKSPAPLTLYYTDPMQGASILNVMLTDDGNLISVGGYDETGLDDTLEKHNFMPLASVWLLNLGGEDTADKKPMVWAWLLLLVCILVSLAAMLYKRCRPVFPTGEKGDGEDMPVADNSAAILMQQISELMEKERLFLKSDLKVSHIAARLNTNSTYVSQCINSCRGCSFTQFVNEYRVEYAKALLRSEPDKKVAQLYAEAGFANETTFFRVFKSVAGLPPGEWIRQNLLSNQ